MADDVPEEYDDWTVLEVTSEVEEIDDQEVLQSWLVYEQDNKDRSTAIEAIEDRLDEISVDSETVDEEEEDDSPELDDFPDGETRIRVRNHKKRGQHIAGYSWRPGEAKLIPDRPDVRKALRTGDLQYVGPR